MFNFRYPKYLISGAKFDDSNTLLIEFCIHCDSGGTISPAIIRRRVWVLSQLLSGSSFFISTMNNNEWHKGEKVILNHVAGRLYINTRPDLQLCDWLGSEITEIYNRTT